jgi:hypothetical protein
MKKTVQYSNSEERQIALDNNINLALVEERNIIEGNFLIFSDVPLEKEIVYANVPQEEFEKNKEQILQLKENQVATNRIVDESGTAQQELLELLIDMEVI